MSIVVDTCILIDIADADPEFGERSARCLAQHLGEGLLISPITYVELAPVFDGSARLLATFLEGVGMSCDSEIDEQLRHAALSAWSRQIAARRAGTATRRPVADVFIGALATQHSALITRNEKDFRALFPKLHVISP